MMEEDDSEREREEREIIQLHRLCSRSRSQTICVRKEEGTKKKKETRRKREEM